MDKPISYLQTDPRWANVDYSAKGEKTTIGKSGCGPTAMAMVLATWADKSVTPKSECAWALAHGYKAPHQGTYYGYFAPAAKRFGLTCKMLNGASIYGKPNSPYHAQAKAAVDQGDLVIACMGRGLWTSSGHFVLLWKIAGNTIYINDPASTRMVRTQGDYSLFKQQVKYYFVVEKPATIQRPEKEDDDMDINKLLAEMTGAQAYALYTKAMAFSAAVAEPEWSKKQGHWEKATLKGVVDGQEPERPVKRDELAAVLGRLGVLD
jgi:hypothetical protein